MYEEVDINEDIKRIEELPKKRQEELKKLVLLFSLLEGLDDNKM